MNSIGLALQIIMYQVIVLWNRTQIHNSTQKIFYFESTSVSFPLLESITLQKLTFKVQSKYYSWYQWEKYIKPFINILNILYVY